MTSLSGRRQKPKLASWETIAGSKPVIESRLTMTTVTFTLKSSLRKGVDTINENGRLVLSLIENNPGISAVAIAEKIGKSIITAKRAIKILAESGMIEYKGSKKTGGYHKTIRENT